MTEAANWFKEAALQGDERGQLNLGILYNDGIGVERNPKEAMKWIKMAADQGNATAKDIIKRFSAKPAH